MPETISPAALVTDAELAALVGVTDRRIRQLAESGVLERVERGRYALGPSLRALLDDAADKGSELQRERTRKTRADADLAELELAKQRGELALISEFERVQTARAAVIQTNIMRVPQRAVLRLLGESDETRWKAVMRGELTTALRTAAEEELQLPEDETE